VRVSSAPAHAMDDERASRGGENIQADVNGTEEQVAIRIAVHRLSDGRRYRRRCEQEDARRLHDRPRESGSDHYLTQTGMRMSMVEETAFPSCMAGKKRQRLSVSSSARFNSRLGVG
jgi:hypothetical protein